MTARCDGISIGRFRRRTGTGTALVVGCIGGSPESLFKFQQLAHEIEIGRDDGPSLLHHRVGIDQTQPSVTHEVSDGDGR